MLVASCESLNGGWSFEIMLERKAFYSIPNYLEVGSLKLLVIMTGWKPTFWKCREANPLTSFCPERKASGSQAPVNQNLSLTVSLISTSLVMGMPASRTCVFKPQVRSSSKFTFPEELSPAASAVVKKGEGEWLVTGRAKEKRQTVGVH